MIITHKVLMSATSAGPRDPAERVFVLELSDDLLTSRRAPPQKGQFYECQFIQCYELLILLGPNRLDGKAYSFWRAVQ